MPSRGFVAQPGADVPLPGADTVWTAAGGQKLTPTTPVTLTWDNGKGLVFTRKFAVDRDYMFTLTNSVANKGNGSRCAVAVLADRPPGPAEGCRRSILHEGFVGMLGDTGVLEPQYKDIREGTGRNQELQGQGWLARLHRRLLGDRARPRSGADGRRHLLGVRQDRRQDVPGRDARLPDDDRRRRDGTWQARAFSPAPRVVSLLDSYKKQGIDKFDLLIDWDYNIGPFTLPLWFITQPMFRLLDGIYKVVGNFGLAIIGIDLSHQVVLLPARPTDHTCRWRR